MHAHLHTYTIDLFAVVDLAALAMENWGLITFVESELLYDNLTGPVASKKSVSVLIAHELAHQVWGARSGAFGYPDFLKLLPVSLVVW